MGYLRRARNYAALEACWVERNGLSGYGGLPRPGPANRYDDVNAWVALALIDLYGLA